MPKRKSAIHIEPKQPAPQMTAEQLEALLASPECAARKAELGAKLKSLIVPQATDAQAAIDLINDQAAMWSGAPTAQRNTILRTLFDSIVVDVDTAQVMRFEPHPALAMLFRAIQMQ